MTADQLEELFGKDRLRTPDVVHAIEGDLEWYVEEDLSVIRHHHEDEDDEATWHYERASRDTDQDVYPGQEPLLDQLVLASLKLPD